MPRALPNEPDIKDSQIEDLQKKLLDTELKLRLFEKKYNDVHQANLSLEMAIMQLQDMVKSFSTPLTEGFKEPANQ